MLSLPLQPLGFRLRLASRPSSGTAYGNDEDDDEDGGTVSQDACTDTREQSKPRQRIGHRGICEIHSRHGVVYYEARILFRGLTVAARSTRNLEEAINYHMALVALKQRVQELEDAEARSLSQSVHIGVQRHELDATAIEAPCMFEAHLRQAYASKLF